MIDGALLLTALFFYWPAGAFFAMGPYFFLAVTSAADVYNLARGYSVNLCHFRPYVVFLLLTKGFWALPVLWHSRVFSKRKKIAWSIAVPLLAVLYFGFLFLYGRALYHYFHSPG